MSPSTRSFGRSPATTCKSEAFRETISSSRERRFTPCCGDGGPDGLEVSMNGKVIGYRFRMLWGSRRGFADYLLERTDPLENFQPSVHAEGEHSFFDGCPLNFRGARALHDQLPEIGRHAHNFVKTLPALEASA